MLEGPKNSEQIETKVEGSETQGPKSPLSGLSCENATARPIAVSMSGDREARPLSGISQADMVIELPAVTGGITRYLAFFGCNQAAEIGSVRSARHDYIPLVMGFDAMMAHWGGSHFALDKLNAGVMDNIDALYLEGSVFYRKLGIAAPHNGFTNYEKLKEYATKKNYRLDSSFVGFKFAAGEESLGMKGRITIGYPSSFKVEYEYDPIKNEYLRFKGGTREMDKNTSQQVAAKNVAIMFAASRQIEGQYNDMDIEGEGKAIVYRNGEEIKGKWLKDKDSLSSKLFFYDDAGQEIEFLPGQTWIQVVQTDQIVDWITGF
ncbi:MAG: DUF3048 domain-containing protein [Candidatus Pacebacteria bacterium]|nr:DUF3048 domain-containing protein [Candidatus Paceibacterota bacterium]